MSGGMKIFAGLKKQSFNSQAELTQQKLVKILDDEMWACEPLTVGLRIVQT